MLKGTKGASSTPATGIQWQNQGSNLGSADASTANLSTNLTGSRAGGTITAVAGGGGSGDTPTYVTVLTNNTDIVYNGGAFTDWSASDVLTSTDVHWDSSGKLLSFDTTGLYEVKIRVQVTNISSDGFTWGLQNSFGSIFNQSTTEAQTATLSNWSNSTNAAGYTTGKQRTWVDVWRRTVSSVGDTATIKVFANDYLGIPHLSGRVLVTVHRLA